MSVAAISWVFQNGPDDASERLVLLAIADYLPDGGEWSPSMAGIAAKAGMTERGVRGIVRRLEQKGYIIVAVGRGRGNRSTYRLNTVKPEHHSRNEKPGMRNTECHVSKTGTPLHKNRNAGSGEPSENHQEPSKKKIDARDDVRAELLPFASPAAVSSFMDYRRKTKAKALTVTAAQRLASSLRAIMDAGGDPDDALGMAEERGWQTIKPDWYFREVQRGNGTQGKPAEDDRTLRAIARAAGAWDA